MVPNPLSHPAPLQRWAAALLLLLLLALVTAGCGGGSGAAMEGSTDTLQITSRLTGTSYPLSLYLPPASAGSRAKLPIVYLLDGETWFNTLVQIAESAKLRILIVAVNTAGQRARDYVPQNSCTANGGGQAAYFDFMRQELMPYVEAAVGGDPDQRTLFGHSHGGSFVLYALFSEAAGHHSFKAYLASDSSLPCMPGVAEAWEASYAAANASLAVRLHLSYATEGNYASNLAYAGELEQRHFDGLSLLAKAYSGAHSAIVPQVLAEAVPFAVAASP